MRSAMRYLRYSIRTGEWAQGDARKLHEAFITGVPVILLRKIRDAVFVPVLPAYVTRAERASIPRVPATRLA